jgi:hypothetical protein
MDNRFTHIVTYKDGTEPLPVTVKEAVGISRAKNQGMVRNVDAIMTRARVERDYSSANACLDYWTRRARLEEFTGKWVAWGYSCEMVKAEQTRMCHFSNLIGALNRAEAERR